jgi:HK97 family phage prohead protease
MELRFQASELRSVGANKVSGRAASYNIRTKIQPGLYEQIAPGAFDRVLRSPGLDVVCLFNHDSSLVLGRTTAHPPTLRLSTDRFGLNFEVDLANTSTANDLRESIKRGDISGCSFAFKLDPQAGDDIFTDCIGDDGESAVLRTIRNVSVLQDVSPVTYPAYAGTSVTARFNQVSNEVRQMVRQFFPVDPKRVRPSDYQLLRDQLREVAFFENKIAELRAPARAKARRRNLLDQF